MTLQFPRMPEQITKAESRILEMCIRDRGTGDILLNGESTRKKKTEQLSRSISLVYQNPEEMFIKDSIRADISYACLLYTSKSSQAAFGPPN